MRTTGERVRAERVAKGWTHQKLANEVKRLGQEITADGIAKLERRGSERPRVARELAIALGVNLDWLLKEKGPKYIKITGNESDFPWELWQLVRPQLQKSIINLIKTYVLEAVPGKEQVEKLETHELVTRAHTEAETK